METNGLVHHLRYSEWATRRVLETAATLAVDDLRRDLRSSYGGLYGTLSHIYQADAIWFDRLLCNPTSDLSAYDPPTELPDLSRTWLAVLQKYISWAEKLEPTEWERIIAYRNIKGEPYESPIWQIVLHVVNHASYHRGQIITMLRQLGHIPASTDLIAYYRETADL